MKLVAWGLLGITCLFIVWKFHDLSLLSLGAGAALGLALFITAFKLQPPPTPISDIEASWQNKYHELEIQSGQTADGLNREVQKLQQKLIRGEERCLSYQKLVDAHQGEIDKLKLENGQISQQLVEKERKLTELRLARLEPDLFDTEKRQTEVSYRELKKKFDEKSAVLDQTRAQLFRTENQLLALQKEWEEQLRAFNPSEDRLILQLNHVEEEKKKLESELLAVQQLVSELSKKAPRKKVVQDDFL